ncbi:HD-GYP domain-containing protein [Luteibacter sp. CQ10]|uniref:HD-GYP domain-containing protein n=1 Tax=Luteibacter sp. CQ10 TaxID=2805821 RepID=UPI0034A0D899
MAYDLVERRVFVSDLEVGMYVSRLDCEWSDTPFPIAGVPITSRDDIERLSRFCKYVFVDMQRRVMPARVVTAAAPRPALNLRLVSRQTYADTATHAEELPRAEEAFEAMHGFTGRLMRDVRNEGGFDREALDAAVRPMVSSVLRSADAFLWVESLRRRDGYAYRRAVGCGSLAAAFGRHMGFDEEAIVSLAKGGLLLDVGMCRLPPEVLERDGPLNDAEWAQARQHVEEGMAILDRAGVTDAEVRDMVATHHERFDGTGYPNGLVGTAIPLAGRIAAIIDTYQAMSADRPYRAPVSQHNAVRHMYAGRDREFQGELVEQFQACIGVYPTGSLVELNTGEVAVVVMQNPARRLQPRVALLSRADKQAIGEPVVVDLMQQEGGVRREIQRTLPFGSHGIDPRGIIRS